MVSILTTISKTHSEWLKTQTSMSLKSLRFQDDNIKPSRTWQTDEEPRISKKEFYSVALNLGYTGFFCLLASFKLALCGPSGKKIERFVEAKGDSDPHSFRRNVSTSLVNSKGHVANFEVFSIILSMQNVTSFCVKLTVPRISVK